MSIFSEIFKKAEATVKQETQVSKPSPSIKERVAKYLADDSSFEEKEELNTSIIKDLKSFFEKRKKMYDSYKLTPDKWQGYWGESDYMGSGYWWKEYIGTNIAALKYSSGYYGGNKFIEYFNYDELDNFDWIVFETKLKNEKLIKLVEELDEFKKSFPLKVEEKQKEIEQLKKELNDNRTK